LPSQSKCNSVGGVGSEKRDEPGNDPVGINPKLAGLEDGNLYLAYTRVQAVCEGIQSLGNTVV